MGLCRLCPSLSVQNATKKFRGADAFAAAAAVASCCEASAGGDVLMGFPDGDFDGT